MIKGFATMEGTKAYFQKHQIAFFEGHSFCYSKLGLGTYIGDFSDEDSKMFKASIAYALMSGVNFVDTAINYRGMRSERDLGVVITDLMNRGKLERNEFIISSKAGIIPGDGETMTRPIHYMNMNLIETGILDEEDVYMEETLWLTMNPKYFEFALEISRKHLNLETIDIYYMHELELSMRHFGAEAFYKNLRGLIETYEKMVFEGKIKEYGMATWEAFQLEETEQCYISLEKVMEVVKSVTEKHHFRHLMVPINKYKNECITNKTQKYLDQIVSLIECAEKFNIQVHASGSVGQGESFDQHSVSEYIQYMTENCNSFFIGTKQVQHLQENIALSNCK